MRKIILFEPPKKNDLVEFKKNNGLNNVFVSKMLDLSVSTIYKNIIPNSDNTTLGYANCFLLASNIVLSDKEYLKIVNFMKDNLGCGVESCLGNVDHER